MKNKANKTIQDVNEISKALKESTENSLKSLMNEAISNLIKEEEDVEKDDEVEDEDDFEVEDVETEDGDADVTPDEEGSEEDFEVDSDAEDMADEDVDMEDFAVGDNSYDLSAEDGETALKVFNKLGDNDKIFVKKEDDGSYSFEDEETGAEYVIELNDDADATEDSVDAEGEAEFDLELDDEAGDDGDADLDIDLELDGESGDDGDAEFDLELDDEAGDDDAEFDLELDDESGDDDEDVDIELDLDDEEDDDLLNEDENFMDWNYQGRTAMTMPAANKKPLAGTRDWGSEGAPQGDEKPYAKSKGDSKPFKKTVNEDGHGFNTQRSMKKSTKHIHRYPTKHRVASEDGEYKGTEINESMNRILKKAKEIQLENKQYKVCIDRIKKSLKEAAVLNVTLGHIVRLLSENTTTTAEKKGIVNRFNNIKTIKESQNLYETIKRELNESTKSNVVLEHQISAKPYNTLNETTIYQSKETNPSLDLMKRMDNLFK